MNILAIIALVIASALIIRALDRYTSKPTFHDFTTPSSIDPLGSWQLRYDQHQLEMAHERATLRRELNLLEMSGQLQDPRELLS